MGSPLHLLALAEANGGREGGSESCEEVGFEEVSAMQRRDDEVVGCKRCRQPISDCGESRKATGEEGTRC